MLSASLIMRLAIVYPVLVTTDTNMGVSGNSLRNSLIIGLVATISPTEEACIQIQFLPCYFILRHALAKNQNFESCVLKNPFSRIVLTIKYGINSITSNIATILYKICICFTYFAFLLLIVCYTNDYINHLSA